MNQRSHSPMFAFLLLAIMSAWFYFVTDMGKRTVDEPRNIMERKQ